MAQMHLQILIFEFLPEQPSSSDWSSQSSILSHFHEFGMQSPLFAHVNSSSAHVASRNNGALSTREFTTNKETDESWDTFII